VSVSINSGSETNVEFTHLDLFADSERLVLPYPPSPIKFRTFPDSRLSTGSHFRFVSTSCIIPGFPYTHPMAKNQIKGFDLLADYMKSPIVQEVRSPSGDPVDSNSINATVAEQTTNLPSYTPPIEFMLFLGDFVYADVPFYFGDDEEAYRRLYRRNFQSPSFRKIYEQLRKLSYPPFSCAFLSSSSPSHFPCIRRPRGAIVPSCMPFLQF
jgi:alkaline phosphatase D